MRQERDICIEVFDRDLYSFGYNYDTKGKRVFTYSPYDKPYYLIGANGEWIMGFRLRLR